MMLIYRLLLTAAAAAAAAASAQNAGAVFLPADSVTVCRLLEKGEGFAEAFLGAPYAAHTLERNGGERLVVNTREFDCVTFVETVTALTLCAEHGERTFSDYLRRLRQLRYRQGHLTDYTSRLHYFSDWIDDNSDMSLVKELQSPNPPFTAVQTLNINFMSTRTQAYSALRRHPGYVKEIKAAEQALTGRRYRYIPKNAVDNTPLMRQTVKDGDIIAITSGKKGLDIAHLGFAVWRDDGLHLLNASQIHHKVVIEPMTLREYLKCHSSHTGIRVVKIY